jgi:hypothetical protein
VLLEALTTAAGLGMLCTCGELAAPRVWAGLMRAAERWHTPRPKCTYPKPGAEEDRKHPSPVGDDLSRLDGEVQRRIRLRDGLEPSPQRCRHGVLMVNFPGGVCDCYGRAGGVGGNGGSSTVRVVPRGPGPKSTLE